MTYILDKKTACCVQHKKLTIVRLSTSPMIWENLRKLYFARDNIIYSKKSEQAKISLQSSVRLGRWQISFSLFVLSQKWSHWGHHGRKTWPQGSSHLQSVQRVPATQGIQSQVEGFGTLTTKWIASRMSVWASRLASLDLMRRYLMCQIIDLSLDWNKFTKTLHCKKRFTSFPSPAGMSLTKLPLGRNNSIMTSLFPPRESLVVTSRLGTGNSGTFFLRCSIC